jgi:hypothetical protein
MSDQERKLEEQYQTDLRDMVDTYRTLKNMGLWAAKLFAFVLVIATLILTVIKIMKK